MTTLPETVLQFGSGRFLRAFADLFIDQSNRYLAQHPGGPARGPGHLANWPGGWPGTLSPQVYGARALAPQSRVPGQLAAWSNGLTPVLS
jgi:hypothetical protein